MAFEMLKTFVAPPQFAPKEQMYSNLTIAVPISLFLVITDAYATTTVFMTLEDEKYNSTTGKILKFLCGMGFAGATMHHIHNTLRFCGSEPTSPLFYFQNEKTRNSRLSIYYHLIFGAGPIAAYCFWLMYRYEKDTKIKPDKRNRLRLLFAGGLITASIVSETPDTTKKWLITLAMSHTFLQSNFIPAQLTDWIYQ